MAGGPLGSRELARRLGMDPTRVNRLVKTLAHLGLTSQTPSRKYTVGPAIHVLATQTIQASGILPAALRAVGRLRQTGCLVALGVLWRDQVSYLFHADPATPVEEGLGRVSLYPATLSSIGMVLLAEQPDETVRDLFKSREIPRYGQDVEKLLQDLARVRECRFARLLLPDSATMAVPVGEAPSMALALSGDSVRENASACLRELQAAAKSLAEENA